MTRWWAWWMTVQLTVAFAVTVPVSAAILELLFRWEPIGWPLLAGVATGALVVVSLSVDRRRASRAAGAPVSSPAGAAFVTAVCTGRLPTDRYERRVVARLVRYRRSDVRIRLVILPTVLVLLAALDLFEIIDFPDTGLTIDVPIALVFAAGLGAWSADWERRRLDHLAAQLEPDGESS